MTALAPHESFTDHAQAFEQMDREQLLAEARKWCFNAIIARDKQHHILGGTDALLAGYQHTIARIWALIAPGGKTVRVDDLRAALLSETQP